MASPNGVAALARAREALEEARRQLNTDGELWASRDVELALTVVHQAIVELGEPSTS